MKKTSFTFSLEFFLWRNCSWSGHLDSAFIDPASIMFAETKQKQNNRENRNMKTNTNKRNYTNRACKTKSQIKDTEKKNKHNTNTRKQQSIWMIMNSEWNLFLFAREERISEIYLKNCWVYLYTRHRVSSMLILRFFFKVEYLGFWEDVTATSLKSRCNFSFDENIPSSEALSPIIFQMTCTKQYYCHLPHWI